MKPVNKKGSTLVFSKLHERAPETMKPAADVNGAEDTDPKTIAASEVMDAINAKDPRALAEALSSLISMCDYEEEESSDEGD